MPEAPDFEQVSRGLITALNTAMQAHTAQRDQAGWESALLCVDAALEVKRALHRAAEDIAHTRVNRANLLASLGRFGEAKNELEECLQVFQNDLPRTANVLGSLGNLFCEQGDMPEATKQVGRALAIRNQLPDPQGRAASHHNLATCLERIGTPIALAESRHHQLADLVYCLVSGLGESLQASLGNYAVRFRLAHVAGTPLVVPRVDELLADPAFHPLNEWLRFRQADLDAVQAAVDGFLERTRQLALEKTKSSGPSPP